MGDRLVRVHDHDWEQTGERWGEGMNSDTLYVDYRCGCGATKSDITAPEGSATVESG